MKLYRGQPYGAPIGSWWTSNIDYARDHIRSKARAWVVLEIDAPPGVEAGEVQIKNLREHALAVRVVDGLVPVESMRTVEEDIKRLEEIGQLVPGCISCDLRRESPDPANWFGPRHKPSPHCESGKRPHCSCEHVLLANHPMQPAKSGDRSR